MDSVLPGVFQRPAFRPLLSQNSGSDDELVTSLPGLIKHNAQQNPDHVFCWQAETGRGEREQCNAGAPTFRGQKLLFRDLDAAVDACASWIDEHVRVENMNEACDTQYSAEKPIALYLESDVGLFMHLAALLSLNIPALLLSVRLSAEAVAHLLQETNSTTVLMSARTRTVLDGRLSDCSKLLLVQPYSTYLNTAPRHQLREKMSTAYAHCRRPRGRYAIILHSSGTTGLPKPISVTHDYPLRYAACHRFPTEKVIDWINVSTLPLYHGFGLLAPCLSLSIGMACVFPPSSVIPAGRSTLYLIRSFEARSLMTVPSVVEDVLALSENERADAFKMMSTFEFLAVGGGALRPEHGATLASHNISFLNHYGVTEIGAIAPIFRPTADYDWRYLRLRDDIGLVLHPVEGTPYWKLSGPAANGNGMFEVQDAMERREYSGPAHIEVRIKGRMDDLIVLKSGEKVRPQQLEEKLHQSPWIKTAVVVGTGYFEVVVLVEPVDPEIDQGILIDRVWEQVFRINQSLDAHARVSSKLAIIPKPNKKPFPRSDKGSILRTNVHRDFKEEIEAAYVAMRYDVTTENIDPMLFESMPEAAVRSMVSSIAGDRIDAQNLGVHEDLYEHGLDSLQTVRLARLLNATMATLGSSSEISTEFVYQNPSIRQLVEATKSRVEGVSACVAAEPLLRGSRATTMKILVDRINRQIVHAPERRPILKEQPAHTILLTGSTGNLGAHCLFQLAHNESIAKIICWCRSGCTAAQARQYKAMSTAGLELSDAEWAKVKVIEGLERLQKPLTDDADELINGLAENCTHVLHLAWPMDFQRTLGSFEPHLALVENLIELCRRAHVIRVSTRVRILFTSSIAAVRNSCERMDNGNIPETRMTDPLSALPMGYAEGKWVCEALLQDTAEAFPQEIDPVVVRVGQVSGPEGSEGVWNPSEHIPALLKASQQIDALPLLDGTISWLPVDRAAACLCELLLHQGELPGVLHLENLIRQPIQDVFALWSRELGLDPRACIVPFDDWFHQAVEAGALGSLEDFFKSHFRDLAHGNVVLDTTKARAVSKTLRETTSVSIPVLLGYVRRWRQAGVLT